ncbi:MAG: FG-GAP-like repeat-containing protein, partial [Candidatus Kariarchaeaceae archaeon]|jgi:hypothetical protein
LADFDGDGIPDVVVTTWDDILYYIDGSTGQQMHNSTNIDVNWSGVNNIIVTGDFNNDSIPDVATGANNTVYFFNGENGDLLYSSIDASSDILTLEVADFNADGVPDVVAGSAGEVIFINGSNGQELFTNTDPASAISSFSVADYNNDTIMDVAAASSNDVYFLNGTNGVTLYTVDDIGVGYITRIISGDFNNDSYIDVAGATVNKEVFFANGSDGQLIHPILTGVSSNFFTDLAAGDFNNDNIDDLVVSFQDNSIYLVDGSSGLLLFSKLISSDIIVTVIVTDFNNDSIDDIALGAHDGNVYFLYYDNTAPILQYSLLPEIASSDVSLNFQLYFDEPNIDTIMMRYKSEASIVSLSPIEEEEEFVIFNIPRFKSNPLKFWFWANDTGGSFTSAGNDTHSLQLTISLGSMISTDLSINGDITYIVTADFTNDGIPDIAAAENGFGNIFFVNGSDGQVLYNSNFGDPFLSVPENATWIQYMSAGNFNNDSIPDIVFANMYNFIGFVNGANGQTMYLNQSSLGGYYGSLTPYEFLTADFNDDLVTDIAFVNEGHVYFINGYNGEILHSTDIGLSISGIALYDANQDDKPDVITSSNTGLHYINGTNGQILSTTPLISSGSGSRDIKTANFNDDDVPDILVTEINYSPTLYLIDGDTGDLLYSHSYLTLIASELADFNKDGIDDVVVSTDVEITIIDVSSGEVLLSFDTSLEITNNFATNVILYDQTGDTVPEIIIAADTNLYIYNGITGMIFEIIELEATQVDDKSNIVLEDFDGNGILDIIVGSTEGEISVVQSMNQFNTVTPIVKTDTEVQQGDQSTIKVNLEDIYDNSINDGSVTLTAFHHKSNTSISFTATNLGNGSYISQLTTENWIVGEWSIYPLVFKVPYDPFLLANYEDQNGKLVKVNSLSIQGSANPIFQLSSNNGTSGPNSITNVVESNEVSIDLNILDTFSHILDDTDAQVTVTFRNESVPTSYLGQGKVNALLNTTGLATGTYIANITIQGNYLSTTNFMLSIGIIPRDMIAVIEFNSEVIQGDTIAINTKVFDILGNPIPGAGISLQAKQSGDSPSIFTIASEDLGNGTYTSTVSTESYFIGEWALLPFAVRSPYDRYDINPFENDSGSLVDLVPLSITGISVPVFVLTSEDANWSSKDVQISGVVEGNKIEFRMDIHDGFSHTLSESDVDVAILFNDITQNVNFESGLTVESIFATNGFKFGNYSIRVTIGGEFLETRTYTLGVDIVPQFPDTSSLISNSTLRLVFIISTLLFGGLLWGLGRIRKSLSDSYEVSNRLVKRSLVIMGLVFVLSAPIIFIASTQSTFTTFLLLLISLGLGIIVVFLWHFKITLKQYYDYNKGFKKLPWLTTIALSFGVGIILGAILLFGEENQWIGYKMSQETTDVLLLGEIPRLVWELGITGFVTGVILDVYDTYSDLKNIKTTEEKIHEGYYPKEPNKLSETISEEVKNTFISLSRGFLLWYFFITITIISSLELYPLILLFGSAFIPFVLMSLLLSRDLIASFMQQLGISSAAVSTKAKSEIKKKSD